VSYSAEAIQSEPKAYKKKREKRKKKSLVTDEKTNMLFFFSFSPFCTTDIEGVVHMASLGDMMEYVPPVPSSR
jgi:hypothetical protein